MTEVIEVRCKVCGTTWDPHSKVLGDKVRPNALVHPVITTLERERRALLAVARLARRFVREDPANPSDVLWGELAGGGLSLDEFVLEMDDALAVLEGKG
jgi:hypothetical protein